MAGIRIATLQNASGGAGTIHPNTTIEMRREGGDEELEREGHGGEAPDARVPEERVEQGDGLAVEDAPTDLDQPPPSDELRGLAEMRDRHLRLAAEFDNYRKRVARERSETWQRAQAELAERLLDPLDDLQRFTSADPQDLTEEAVLEGMRLVERKITKTLEAAGLEALDAEGQPFDPEIHEAVTTAPTDDREADESVADVFQRGYRFKGTLLRPARVRVHRYTGR
jgi:molecular chaperone GrpE